MVRICDIQLFVSMGRSQSVDINQSSINHYSFNDKYFQLTQLQLSPLPVFSGKQISQASCYTAELLRTKMVFFTILFICSARSSSALSPLPVFSGKQTRISISGKKHPDNVKQLLCFSLKYSKQIWYN